MNKPAPIVAELGRPETPSETAARKAESSRVYRASQNFRNLIAALIVTVAVVAVIVFAVPRGEPVPPKPIDLAGIAVNVEDTMSGPVLVPEIPKDWRVNGAELQSTSAIPVWDIVAAPDGEKDRGFLHITQAFGADSSWAPQVLNGIAPTSETEVGGLTWDVFEIANPDDNGNVSYAIGTQAGDDYILLYGSMSAKDTAAFAENLIPQIIEISEAS